MEKIEEEIQTIIQYKNNYDDFVNDFNWFVKVWKQSSLVDCYSFGFHQISMSAMYEIPKNKIDEYETTDLPCRPPLADVEDEEPYNHLDFLVNSY